VVQVDIAAPLERVWAVVTDIDLPARFSDEFLGATWNGDGPGEGLSFVGRNRHPAIGEWEVESFVDCFEEGRSFGWATVDRVNPGRGGGSTSTLAQEARACGFSMSMGPGPSGFRSPSRRCRTRSHASCSVGSLEHHVNMMRTVEGIKTIAEATS